MSIILIYFMLKNKQSCLKGLFMPEITREEAVQKAREEIADTFVKSIQEISDILPDNCRIYMPERQEKSCWYIFFTPDNSLSILQSTRVIAISKETGEVIYNGSANDEG